MSAWNKPASGRNKMPPTRVRRTDGRNSSATWSVSLGGWTDHEREIHCLLDDYRTRCVFHERGRYAGGTIYEQPPWVGAGAWLSNVLLCDHRSLESAWSHCHTRAAFSAAQGMGVCRHLLRPDRRRHILRRRRRLRGLRLSRHRPAFDCRSDCDIVGAAAAQPHHWRPPSRDKHRGSVNTLELLG